MSTTQTMYTTQRVAGVGLPFDPAEAPIQPSPVFVTAIIPPAVTTSTLSHAQQAHLSALSSTPSG